VEDETLIANALLLAGILIIFLGFLMIMIGIALSTLRNSELRQDYSETAEKAESRVKGGGVIMLGPIPIIFGSDKESAKTAAILAIILMLLSLLILKGSLF
jgi:uncharacterized protein (TIGR00304 family)